MESSCLKVLYDSRRQGDIFSFDVTQGLVTKSTTIENTLSSAYVLQNSSARPEVVIDATRLSASSSSRSGSARAPKSGGLHKKRVSELFSSADAAGPPSPKRTEARDKELFGTSLRVPEPISMALSGSKSAPGFLLSFGKGALDGPSALSLSFPARCRIVFIRLIQASC